MAAARGALGCFVASLRKGIVNGTPFLGWASQVGVAAAMWFGDTRRAAS